jgi:hypothetical protein
VAAAVENLDPPLPSSLASGGAGVAQIQDACLVALWAVREGRTDDAAATLAAVRALDAGGRRVQWAAEGCGLLLDATLAVTRGEPDAARRVDALETWSLQGYSVFAYLDGALALLVGQLRREAGDLDGAQQAYARCCAFAPRDLVFHTTALYELGRVAAARGDTAAAVDALGKYVQTRADADPWLQDKVRDARDELARLTGGEP